MADTPISGLTAYSAYGASDLLVVVDVNDTTMAPSGTDKKMTFAQMRAIATGAVTTWTSTSLGVGNAVVAQGSTTYGTDQTTALQALITAAAGGILVIDGQYSITGSLALPSNIWIIFPEGCGLIKQANSAGPMMYNAGMVSGGAMVSGARGVGGTMATAIGNVVPATLTAPGSFLNTNIKISGGIFNGNGQHQSTTWNSTFSLFCNLQFFGCDGVTIEDATLYDPTGFATWHCNCQNFYLNRVKWDLTNRSVYSAGGPQLDGPNRFFAFRDCEGLTYDDTIALNSDDGLALVGNLGPWPFGGAITDGLIDGYTFNSAGQNANGFRLLSNNSLIDRITFTNVRGQVGAFAMQANQFRNESNPPTFQTGSAGPGNFGTITFSDIQINVNALASGLGFVDNAGVFNIASNTGSFVFDNVRVLSPTVAQPLVYVNSRYGNFSPDSISIHNCEYIETTTGNHAPLFKSDGRVKRLSITKSECVRHSTITQADSPIALVTGLNSPLAAESILVSDCYTDNVNSMVEFTGGRVGYLKAAGSYHRNSGGSYGVTIASGTVIDNFDTTGLVTDANSGTNYSNSGTITNNITTGGTFAIRSGIPNLWDGLMAYWRMNETTGTNVVDQLGVYNLTAQSTIASTTGNTGGNAAVFNSGQYYLSGDTGTNAGRLLNCALQPQPYTMAGWVNFSALSGTQLIAGRYNSTTDSNFGILYLLSGKFNASAGPSPITVSTSPTTSTWYHLAMVCDPYGVIGAQKTFYLYVNGALNSSATYSPPYAAAASNAFAFGATSNGVDLLTAALDSWGVWGIPMNAYQVGLLYNSGTGINVI